MVIKSVAEVASDFPPEFTVSTTSSWGKAPAAGVLQENGVVEVTPEMRVTPVPHVVPAMRTSAPLLTHQVTLPVECEQ